MAESVQDLLKKVIPGASSPVAPAVPQPTATSSTSPANAHINPVSNDTPAPPPTTTSDGQIADNNSNSTSTILLDGKEIHPVLVSKDLLEKAEKVNLKASVENSFHQIVRIPTSQELVATSSVLLDEAIKFVPTITSIFCLIFFGGIIARKLSKKVFHWLSQSKNSDEALNYFISSSIRYAIIIFITISVFAKTWRSNYKLACDSWCCIIGNCFGFSKHPFKHRIWYNDFNVQTI